MTEKAAATELDISGLRSLLARNVMAAAHKVMNAIDNASDQNKIAYLTEEGKRVAAIVPVDIAVAAEHAIMDLLSDVAEKTKSTRCEPEITGEAAKVYGLIHLVTSPEVPVIAPEVHQVAKEMGLTQRAQPAFDQPMFDRFTATDYLAAHDKDAKDLNRKAIFKLREIHEAELKAQNITRIMGGPVSHDELVNAILELRYPLANDARRVRAEQ